MADRGKRVFKKQLPYKEAVFLIDICCKVNTINMKEGENLKITMQIKLQPTKDEAALLDF